MPVFFLPEDNLVFPHPFLANKTDGLLAIGGGLSVERLRLAYHFGIFPWFNPGEPTMWFSPNPRSVLFPKDLKVAKSMRRYFNNEFFTWSLNQNFQDVIENCGKIKRKNQDGTWIGDEIKKAYIELNKLGLAHSVEVWRGNELVGGLYGVWLGKVFFGESMFSKEKNASKFGFISFVNKYANLNKLALIDCQVENEHLLSLGATNISGHTFLKLIKKWAWSF